MTDCSNLTGFHRYQLGTCVHCGASAAAAQTPANEDRRPDPLDMPLPCDIQIGLVRFRKGLPLRHLVATAAQWQDMALEAVPGIQIASLGTGVQATEIPGGGLRITAGDPDD